MRWAVIVAAFVALTSFSGNFARAESLVAALSSDVVRIESNFTGTEIVVFGEIARDAATIARAESYDLAIVVSGPPQDVTTRRKGRFLGLWVNKDSEKYPNVPSFYAAHVTRPVIELAQRGLLEKLQIGIHNVNLVISEGSEIPLSARFDFRSAFLRLRVKSGLYAERAGSVEFLSESLFRTTVPLPAIVPVGTYTVHTYLLRGGALLAEQENKLRIAKTGIEQLTYTMAYRYSALYGAAAIIFALLTGWIAGVVFRRD